MGVQSGSSSGYGGASAQCVIGSMAGTTQPQALRQHPRGQSVQPHTAPEGATNREEVDVFAVSTPKAR
eukprot:scaffold198365_cov41-Tisochrysis_lutea.AAC.2